MAIDLICCWNAEGIMQTGSTQCGTNKCDKSVVVKTARIHVYVFRIQEEIFNLQIEITFGALELPSSFNVIHVQTDRQFLNGEWVCVALGVLPRTENLFLARMGAIVYHFPLKRHAYISTCDEIVLRVHI